MPMKLTNVEKETILTFNKAGGTASVYTHNEALKRQLSELCQTYPEQVRQTAANGWGRLPLKLPKKWLKVSSPRKPTPAHLDALARMTQERVAAISLALTKRLHLCDNI